MINILVVEDDNNINALLKDLLVDKDYKVVQAFSGTEAMLCLEKEKFDLILLDLMIPGITGEEVIRRVRKVSNTLIIVLSAKDDVESKVEALKLGADDYVTKPFDNNEILARVEANLRRNLIFNNDLNKSIIYKNIELNTVNHKVFVSGKELHLTPKEFGILNLLISNPSKVFTKSNIFESVWEESFIGDDNAVNVHVSNLRNKINSMDNECVYIKTVWGIGFKLED